MGRVIAASTIGNSRPPAGVGVGRNKLRQQGSSGSREILSSPPTSNFSGPLARAPECRAEASPPLQSPPERLENSSKKRHGFIPPMSSRKYCCFNSPQKECKLWALVDIITAFFIWILLTFFAITLKTDQQLLEAIVESDRENERDLNRFLHYSPIKQDLTITVAIIREMTSVILGALLFLASKRRDHQQLQMWLVATFIAVIVDLVLFIPKMAFTQNKFLYAAMMMAYFLYKWYEVWIVSVLYKEVREDEVQHGKLDMNGESNSAFERDSVDGYDKPPELTSSFNQYATSGAPNMNTIGANLRNYGRVGMVNTTGWETDTVYSNDTFVLSQPPKRRVNLRGRPGDTTGYVDEENLRRMDPDYEPAGHLRY